MNIKENRTALQAYVSPDAVAIEIAVEGPILDGSDDFGTGGGSLGGDGDDFGE